MLVRLQFALCECSKWSFNILLIFRAPECGSIISLRNMLLVMCISCLVYYFVIIALISFTQYGEASVIDAINTPYWCNKRRTLELFSVWNRTKITRVRLNCTWRILKEKDIGHILKASFQNWHNLKPSFIKSDTNIRFYRKLFWFLFCLSWSLISFGLRPNEYMCISYTCIPCQRLNVFTQMILKTIWVLLTRRTNRNFVNDHSLKQMVHFPYGKKTCLFYSHNSNIFTVPTS